MTAPHGQGAPRSTVADLMAAIRQRYADIGDTTPVLVGERHAPEIAAPPRIVLVRAGGKVTGTGRTDTNIARFDQGVRAYLWGAETVDDIQRYAAVDAMFDRLVNILRALAPGRIEISVVDLSDASVETFGEHLQVLATWSRGVPRDAVVWRAPVAPKPTPDPMAPNGDTGDTFEIEPTTNGSR